MICMFLFYLRHYPCLSVLSALSGNCGEASALTVIKDVLPQFLAHYGHYIKMEVRAGGLISNDTSIGSLDGTPLNIHRPGEDERRYYRGDKARHFVTALILCNREEQILWVGVGFPGHENDQGNYNISNLRIFLEQQQLTVIADGGFYGPQMVRPVISPHTTAEKAWNAVVQHDRSVIEHVNAHIKNWKILSQTFRGNINHLCQCSIAVCALHNLMKRIS